MKHENKWKRKGKKVLSALNEKTLEEIWGKTTKILLGILDRLKRERKAFEKFESDRTHEKLKVFKKLSIRFLIDWKLDSIDRKSLSIDPTAID